MDDYRVRGRGGGGVDAGIHTWREDSDCRVETCEQVVGIEGHCMLVLD